MNTKAIVATAGATLLALTGTASAGPRNEMSAAAIMPLQMLTKVIAYHPRFHHYGCTSRLALLLVPWQIPS
jgi:hypothetical protein